jgi:hypothetical protein
VDSTTGRKRHRYFVLAPQYLCVFESEDGASISDAGFMLGVAELPGTLSADAAAKSLAGVQVPEAGRDAVDFEAEEDVARLIGDAPAHTLVQTAKRAVDALRSFVQQQTAKAAP